MENLVEPLQARARAPTLSAKERAHSSVGPVQQSVANSCVYGEEVYRELHAATPLGINPISHISHPAQVLLSIALDFLFASFGGKPFPAKERRSE